MSEGPLKGCPKFASCDCSRVVVIAHASRVVVTSCFSMYKHVQISGVISRAAARDVHCVVSAVLRDVRAPRDTSFEVEFVCPSTMHHISATYKGKDKATDVLSFVSGDDEIDDVIGDTWDCDTGSQLGKRMQVLDRGSMYVCPGYMLRKVQRYPTRNLPLQTYMVTALVHATLHMMGFDHDTDEQFAIMRRKEKDITLRIAAAQHRGTLPQTLDVFSHALLHR